MARNGSGVYSKPAGTTAVASTTIESAKFNTLVDDIVDDLNAARPIVAGGTGATSASAARDNLGTSSKVLSKSSAYTAVAGDRSKVIRCTATMTLSLTAAATLGDGWFAHVVADGGAVTVDPDGSETIDGSATLALADGGSAIVHCDGTGFYTVGATTSAGTLAVADGGTGATTAADARTNLGVAIGSDVQAYDAELAALAGLTSAASKVPYFTGSETAGLLDFVDEDDMASDSATAVPSQQSVKAYVGAQVATVSNWQTIGLYEPTSDASTWTIATGLSGYKAIRARVLISCSSGSAELTISGRVTSGTWRTIYTTTTQTVAADDVLMIAAEVHNWNGSDGTIGRKPIFASGGDDTATLTASGDFTPAGNMETGIGQIGSTNGGEAWDEIRVSVSNGNINGTTASERGWAVLEGIPE